MAETSVISPVIPKPSSRIESLDFIRGIAIIHIILYHYFIEWYHGSFLIVPEGVMANISRLQTFQDGGVLGFVKNIFAFLFSYGFFSVNLFLVLSGFVLTFSALKNQMEINSFGDLMLFYWKKLKRIVIPMYISIIIGIGFLYLRNILFPMYAAAPIFTVLDILKLLFPPFLIYDMVFLQKFNGDLWFITLILQLYILFPFLLYILRKLGIWKFLFLSLFLTIGYRYIATYYLSSAPMGVVNYPTENSYRLFSFFLPRLAEFTVGMVLAAVYMNRNTVLEKLSSVWVFLLGVTLSLGGFALDMYRWGWPYADFVVSLGLFLFFLNIGNFFARSDILKQAMLKLSDNSYDIYLLHHYLLNYFLMPLIFFWGIQQEATFWIVLPIFFIGSYLIGWFEQWLGSKIR